MWENTALEAESRNLIITDKHRLKVAEKVSRNSRKENQFIQTLAVIMSTFGPQRIKERFAYFVALDKVRGPAP